ncbi:hypothetical protein M6D93_04430 [Jatrophihabitans telluris]|uniref:YceI family protein n=1 Tax=Jatrophihabitans telluris TaxID=2038343 RepID=A0ABY4R046_9ACTN|nr:hypothetical protein [Jatrophihabitans telluris]UQX89253.1 hypothetical protein M6D93_04430 [Jatrophihabitans telluris]
MLAVAGAFTLGMTGNDRVTVNVEGRAHPGAVDYWDGNSMITPILVHVGGFTAKVAATLRMNEIHRFNEGLKYMNQNLEGTAVLASMELWIDLTVRCEPNGHLSVVGDVRENPGTNTHLEFQIDHVDQTVLPGLIASLDAIEREFPVLGRP